MDHCPFAHRLDPRDEASAAVNLPRLTRPSRRPRRGLASAAQSVHTLSYRYRIAATVTRLMRRHNSYREGLDASFVDAYYLRPRLFFGRPACMMPSRAAALRSSQHGARVDRRVVDTGTLVIMRFSPPWHMPCSFLGPRVIGILTECARGCHHRRLCGGARRSLAASPRLATLFVRQSGQGVYCHLLTVTNLRCNARELPRGVPQRAAPSAMLGAYVQEHRYDRLFHHGDWP
jgi:hypothetical protein